MDRGAPMTPAHISNHAVLRFLERGYGLGEFIAGVREEMRVGVAVAIDGRRVVTAIRKKRVKKYEHRAPREAG